MVLVALGALRRATGAGTWLGATPGGVALRAAARRRWRRCGGGRRRRGAAWRRHDDVGAGRRARGWAARRRRAAASAAARALRISAAGMPKMVLVALPWRAAWADGAGAGTGAGVAAGGLRALRRHGGEARAAARPGGSCPTTTRITSASRSGASMPPTVTPPISPRLYSTRAFSLPRQTSIAQVMT